MAPYGRAKVRPGLPEGYQYPTPKQLFSPKLEVGQRLLIDGEIYTVIGVKDDEIRFEMGAPGER